MSAIRWDITFSGSFRVKCSGQELTHFRTRKTAALLAYLAFYPQRPHRRDEISEQLWPDHTPDAARNLLRVTLTHLRKALETDSEEESLLVTDRDHVRLRTEALHTDRRRFDELLDQANRTSDEADKLNLLKSAEELHCGDLLPEFDEEWIVGERQRWNDAYLIVLRQIIKSLAATRDFEAAQEFAHKALAIDPYREESHRTLMKLFVMSGRVEAALRQYDDLSQLLATQLHSRPSAVTTKLLQEIQTLDATSAVLPSAPSRPLASVPRNRPNPLPSRLPPLFGREADVARLQEMLATPETPLITLTGLGGAGKTRLALATAHQATARFGEEVYFVPLAALTQGDQIPDAILSALPVERHAAHAAMDQVIAFFANREALLVLDNCEHLLRPGAAVIQTLVETAPTLTCLVTSRERLRLRCEYEYAVRMLATPLPTDPLHIVASSASAQMFMERAHRVRPDFAITPENLVPVAHLCRWLEGLPLAIELAAAWTRTLTPSQILERLKSRFDMLATDQQDFPARHASLRAALEGSYQLLPANLQQFLPRLSIFQGGMDLEAVEAVCHEPDAHLSLNQLGERSLLVTEEAGDTLRYRLLETVRQYAEEKLQASGEAKELAQRHANYFMTWAEEQEKTLEGNRAAAALKRIDQDYDNLRSALQWCITVHTPESHDLGLRLARGIWRNWDARGHVLEGMNWFEKLLCQPHGEIAVRARALASAGNLAFRNSHLNQAQQHYEECLQICREIGDTLREAGILANLGNIAHDAGKTEEAREAYIHALAIARQLGDGRRCATQLANLGMIMADTGRFSEAMEFYGEALILVQQSQNRFSLGLLLINVSNVQISLRNLSEARTLLSRALEISLELDDLGLQYHTAFYVGLLATTEAHWDDSIRLLSAVDAYCELTGREIGAKLAHQRSEAIGKILAHSSVSNFETQWSRGKQIEIHEIASVIKSILGITSP